MLIVNLIWIVLGIVYVVYKLIKEGEISGKSVILLIATVTGLTLIGYIFNDIGNLMDSNCGQIVSVIPALLIFTLMFFCFIRYGIPSIFEDFKEKRKKQTEFDNDNSENQRR